MDVTALWQSASIHYKKALLIVLIAIVLVATSVIITPRALALYYQIQGGQILDRVINSNGDISSYQFSCIYDPIDDKKSQEELEAAVSLFSKSITLQSSFSHTYLLLGNTNCLLGKYDQAVESFLVYTDLRPKNPLGFQEFGFAYLSMCYYPGTHSDDKNESAGLTDCHDEQLRTNIFQKWQENGLNPDDFIRIANEALLNHLFSDALRWYEWGEKVGAQLSRGDLFGLAVASIMAGKSLPDQYEDSILFIHSLEQDITIEGETLQWIGINQGEQLKAQNWEDTTTGIFWWSGCAITALNNPDPGSFVITVRALDSPPAPIKLEVMQNFIKIGNFSLENEDNNFKDLVINRRLEKGIHLFAICYLNDGNVNGMDRNARVDWIRFIRN